MSERLQLDLLVGRRVFDSQGRKLGRVGEIRLVREGNHYAVEGLLVGLNGVAQRLGVAWFLEHLNRRLSLNAWSLKSHIIYWEQIEAIEAQRIRLKVPRVAIQTIELEQ
jgi:sporulation protein YlmC with PRC-barrel domain